jgi:hypothetical protein
MSRDRDVRNAIQTALQATDAFDGVYVWGLPEDYGSGASKETLAVILPMSSRQEDLWDSAAAGGLVITSRVVIMLAYRLIDPQLRDEGAELLLDTTANALNGQNLAGFTLPQTTRVIQWDWQPVTIPERRINCVFSYQYIVDPDWNAYDVTP